MPARRAPLTRERGSDLLHPAGCLVLQPARQQAPTRSQDLPIQPGLLPDVPAGGPGGPFGRARHVPDAQVLDSDHVEPARDIRGCLLGPVLPRICLAGAQPRHGQLDPCSPVRPPLGTGKPTLKASQTLVAPRAQPRCRQHLTRRQRRADRYPAVDADGLPVTWAGDRLRDYGERDVPAASAVKRDAVGLHLRRHRAGPAEPYPSGLRDAHLAHAAGQTAHVTGPDGDDPESLVPAGLPPRRTVMRAAQVVTAAFPLRPEGRGFDAAIVMTMLVAVT